jgi:hypothetical protein
MIARARASWEELGLLPEPRMAHIAGPTVHRHQCNANCYSYEPGWYPVEKVIAILRTLPGSYRENIAELERKAARLERRRAA